MKHAISIPYLLKSDTLQSLCNSFKLQILIIILIRRSTAIQ